MGGMVASVQSKIDFAKSMRMVDPSYAVGALETVLEQNAKDPNLFGPKLAESVQGAIQAEDRVKARRMLVERLDAVGCKFQHDPSNEEFCSQAAMPLDLQELLTACEFGDTKL